MYANARLLKAVYLPAYGEFGMDWIACVGSGLIILGVLKEPRIEHALEAPLLLWLGKISYSFYLYHLLVIILIFRIIVTYKLNGPIVDVAAALMSFLCSLALAVASEYWIERPSRTPRCKIWSESSCSFINNGVRGLKATLINRRHRIRLAFFAGFSSLFGHNSAAIAPSPFVYPAKNSNRIR